MFLLNKNGVTVLQNALLSKIFFISVTHNIFCFFCINNYKKFYTFCMFWARPANIRLDKDVFRLRLQKTSWSRRICSPSPYVFRRRLQDAFKKSWSRPIYSSWSYVFKTSSLTFSRRLQGVFKTSCQDVFKTFSKRLAKASSRHLQDFLKTFSRRLAKPSSNCFQNVFKKSWKTSSRHLQDVFKTSCKDIFKTFWRRIIKLNCSC